MSFEQPKFTMLSKKESPKEKMEREKEEIKLLEEAPIFMKKLWPRKKIPLQRGGEYLNTKYSV